MSSGLPFRGGLLEPAVGGVPLEQAGLATDFSRGSPRAALRLPCRWVGVAADGLQEQAHVQLFRPLPAANPPVPAKRLAEELGSERPQVTLGRIGSRGVARRPLRSPQAALAASSMTALRARQARRAAPAARAFAQGPPQLAGGLAEVAAGCLPGVGRCGRKVCLPQVVPRHSRSRGELVRGAARLDVVTSPPGC